MSNEIPTASRLLVAERDAGHCVRCGGHGTDWHHRRRRGVKDEHTHAACNGITLCPVCHAWCHANPTAAKAMGWIVTAHGNPHDEPVMTFLYQWTFLNHDGTFHIAGECENCGRIMLVDSGLCLSCLRAEVCCSSPQMAAAAMCGCGGSAAVAMSRLIERERDRT